MNRREISDESYPLNLLDELEGGKWKHELPVDLNQSVEYVLAGLSEKEARVIHALFRDGKRQIDIARELSLSKSRIGQILNKGLRRLQHPTRKDYMIYGVKGMAYKAVQEALNYKLETAVRKVTMISKIISENAEVGIEQIKKIKEICEAKTRDETVAGDTPIENLDFSVRTYNCLKRSGINTVDDILSTDYNELLCIRNMGKKSFKELFEKMDFLGYPIKSDDDVPVEQVTENSEIRSSEV